MGDNMKGTINLHKGFSQGGGVEINHTTSQFPGGEVYVNVEIPNWCSAVRINSRCNNSDDLMRIILTTDAVRRAGIQFISLFLPYLPYSRQDRICEKGDSFSLKVVCKLLKICDFTKIETYDNHSNVAEVLLNNLYNNNNHREVDEFMNHHVLNGVVLIAPDAGAVKKAQAYCRDNDRIIKVVQCQKTRIGGRVVIDRIKENIKGQTCLVVDDICDGGRTFNELAEKLWDAGSHNNYLFVSHGIFSAGFDELHKNYVQIGTTNSIEESRNANDCTVFPIIY